MREKRGRLFRRFLPELGRYCYGVVHSEVYLMLFDFLTIDGFPDQRHVSPEHIKGALFIAKLSKDFEGFGVIDMDGGVSVQWDQSIPVSYFIHPEHFRKGPKGEDVYKTYNFSESNQVPKVVTLEEIKALNYYPRLWLGDGDDDEKLLINIVGGYRTLEASECVKEPNGAPISCKAEPEFEVTSVRYSIPIASVSEDTSRDPGRLADMADEIEENIHLEENEELIYEVAYAGQELDGELFWVVDFYESKADGLEARIAGVFDQISTALKVDSLMRENLP
jgi:hypothetical protein